MTSTTPTPDDPRIHELADRLTLEEKVMVLTGRDFWTTWPIESIGLRRMLLSDGPSGVRGETWDERSPSLNLPSATALSASWDVDLARRYGAVSATEARRKDVDVVLGPTINLHRSPLGGRHFEAFSEDPLLTADLAAAYVRGVQSNGVAATPKHYIANDFETDRFTADVRVDDRSLRELYLRAFEKAVAEAGAWLVMSSYNSINGVTATENDLLETPLNSEWGFDGVVVSDWTAVRSIQSARASQDLVMPGPVGPWGDALVAAVNSGQVPLEAVDRKVRRILTLAARVGALEGFPGTPVVDREDGRAFAREAAAEGMVLVRNDNELPWAADSLTSVAVIGDNARNARTQGGGSATVLPESVVSPLDGLIAALPGVAVEYALGAIVQEGVVEFPLSTIRNPSTGEPGLRARFLGADGDELFVEDRFSANLVWFGGDAPLARTRVLELHTTYTPEADGPLRLGFAALGQVRLFVDGALVMDTQLAGESEDLGAAILAPPHAFVEVAASRGVPLEVRVEFRSPLAEDNPLFAMSCILGTVSDDSRPDELIAEAVEAARRADVAVVVVGTNSRVESEGFDRSTLDLPGHQDRLVSAVAAVNPRTVVVVNSGSPVLAPWREEVAAVLLGWFGGQEFGTAVADVLLGRAEPGGRLPTTWPAEIADVPVLDVTPVNGVVEYSEGIHIGYRAWLRAGVAPAWEFGHGAGYTTWELSDVVIPTSVSAGGAVEVGLVARNTGSRAGKHVVQVYLSRPESTVDRPVRWLAGFAVVRAAAGESAPVRVTIDPMTFAHWDEGWQWEPGTFTVQVGESVSRMFGEAQIEVVVPA